MNKLHCTTSHQLPVNSSTLIFLFLPNTQNFFLPFFLNKYTPFLPSFFFFLFLNFLPILNKHTHYSLYFCIFFFLFSLINTTHTHTHTHHTGTQENILQFLRRVRMVHICCIVGNIPNSIMPKYFKTCCNIRNSLLVACMFAKCPQHAAYREYSSIIYEFCEYCACCCIMETCHIITLPAKCKNIQHLSLTCSKFCLIVAYSPLF